MRNVTKPMFDKLFFYFVQQYLLQIGNNEVGEKIYDKIIVKFNKVLNGFNKGQDVSKEFWQLKVVVQKYLKFNNN